MLCKLVDVSIPKQVSRPVVIPSRIIVPRPLRNPVSNLGRDVARQARSIRAIERGGSNTFARDFTRFGTSAAGSSLARVVRSEQTTKLTTAGLRFAVEAEQRSSRFLRPFGRVSPDVISLEFGIPEVQTPKELVRFRTGLEPRGIPILKVPKARRRKRLARTAEAITIGALGR